MDIREAALPLDATGISAFLHSLPTPPLLLGLGEARHFVEELGELRNDIFRHLVEHEGYRSIALESDCLRGLLVDDHIATGDGTLDDVMEHGFSHRFGTSPANRELVRWMRAYNRDHDDDHDARLRFFGFDGPLEYWAESPRRSLTALYSVLDGPDHCGGTPPHTPRNDPDHCGGTTPHTPRNDPLPCTRETLDTLLGPDERWSDEATATDPSTCIGRSPDAQRLRLITDDLVALLDTQLPRLSPDDAQRAALHARTATGLLRYHHLMADTSPARWTRLSAQRDAMMAANLRAVAEHGPALVFSSNLHLQRNRSVMAFGERQLEWWSAGAITATRLGDRYAFLASALGTVGDDTPPPDTIEGILSALPWDNAIIDAHALGTAVAEPAPRASHDFAYFPLDPAHLDLIDGIVFLKRAVRLAPLG
ncbi:MAG: erythromycin esterase family protein [Spirillospora sp.]